MDNYLYCNQCGQQLPRTSRFCPKCGAQVVTGPAPGREPSPQGETIPGPGPAARPQPIMARAPAGMGDEHILFTLRPTMLYVFAWYGLAVAVVLAVSVLMGILSSQGVQLARDYWYVVVLAVGVLAFSVPVYKHILRRREVYTLTNYKLEMRYGLIAKNVRNIPLNKIQDVTVTSSVWQRLIRLGDIVIDSASETGKIHLDDIHHPERYANMILNELHRRN